MILAGEITIKHPKGIKILKRVVIRLNPISHPKVIAADIAALSLTPLQQRIAGLETELDSSARLLQQHVAAHAQAQTEVQQQEQYCRQLQAQQLTAGNELQILQREQSKLQQQQSQRDTEQQQLLRQLQVKPGWATAVAMVLGQLQHAAVAATLPQEASTVVMTSQQIAAAGTLAEAIVSGVYPDSFNHILLADTVADAVARQAQLQQGQSLICPQGYWLGTNWALLAGTSQSDSYLLRAERLQQLDGEIAAAAAQLQQVETSLSEQTSLLQQSKAGLQQASEQLLQAEKQHQQQQTNVLLAQQELQQGQRLAQKLDAEIQIQRIWAESFAKRAVPQYVFGANGNTPTGSDSGFSQTANTTISV